MEREISRRRFIKIGLGMMGLAVTAPLFNPMSSILAETESREDDSKSEENIFTLTHSQFTENLWNNFADQAEMMTKFRKLMLETAEACVVNGHWVIPSSTYSSYMFCRDSYWILSALRNKYLSEICVAQFREDQRSNPNGQVATAVLADGSRPYLRDRDEESTLIYILHNYLSHTMGNEIERESIDRAYEFIQSHVKNGRYVTIGETREQIVPGRECEIGAYHYWADTFRPAGESRCEPCVIAYNQGLYCVVLECLLRMNFDISSQTLTLARQAYANMVNTEDGIALPQREGSSIVDVSSLVGEALSLYLFDRPLLTSERVKATLKTFSKVYYPDKSFLGFRIISDYYGDCRPDKEFIHPSINYPGLYHNGGSWLLYDALALYAAARHNVKEANELFVARMQSETRYSFESHEYLSTNKANLGQPELSRAIYGWNSFVARLML